MMLKCQNLIVIFQILIRKLADWDDDEPRMIPKRWEKVVILKNVFTLKELENDITAALDIKQDILEGCEEIGKVTAVTLFDLEPQGVVSVKFDRKEDASRCVERMNHRYFAGRKLQVELYDGEITYRKRKRENDNGNEQERLDQFGTWLEREK
jgi:HIV Tat-specific factor 1